MNRFPRASAFGGVGDASHCRGIRTNFRIKNQPREIDSEHTAHKRPGIGFRRCDAGLFEAPAQIFDQPQGSLLGFGCRTGQCHFVSAREASCPA